MIHNCHQQQITPAFVREAYNLLRQSIIHVELDDIDFDEEELQGERDRAQDQRARRAQTQTQGDDVDMGDMTATDNMEESYNEASLDPSSPTRARGPARQLISTPGHPSVFDQEPPAQPRRKMKITHDKYQQMQSLIVLHLRDCEQRTGHGLDRDELIDWYLESKEDELQTVDDIEYEKELLQKVLRKLIKVCLSAFLLYLSVIERTLT